VAYLVVKELLKSSEKRLKLRPCFVDLLITRNFLGSFGILALVHPDRAAAIARTQSHHTPRRFPSRIAYEQLQSHTGEMFV
jgi:hypothetical protein